MLLLDYIPMDLSVLISAPVPVAKLLCILYHWQTDSWLPKLAGQDAALMDAHYIKSYWISVLLLCSPAALPPSLSSCPSVPPPPSVALCWTEQ